MQLNLDKSGWTKVSFGDVAKKQNGKVDRENTNLTKYVKGEHLNSEDLHIRSYGTLTNEYLGPAFTRSFEPGDILYGSRRTYLRKVAVAHFEGITSNTTFVIKANPKLIEPRLLPFIMLSEGFAQHSIRNSKGSVNPYINWKDIANYQFLLPPKAEQARLAELLWAGDGVVEGLERISKDLKRLRLVVFKEQSLSSEGLAEYRLSDLIADITAGKSLKCGTKEYTEGTPGILKTSAITSKEFKPTEAKPINTNIELPVSVKANSILINRKNTPSLVGTGVFNEVSIPYLYLPDLIWQITADDNLVHPYYLYLYLMSSKFQKKIDSIRSGTSLSMVNISQKNFLKLKVSIPNLKSQTKIMDNVKKAKNSFDKSVGEIKTTRALQKTLINQIF